MFWPIIVLCGVLVGDESTREKPVRDESNSTRTKTFVYKLQQTYRLCRDFYFILGYRQSVYFMQEIWNEVFLVRKLA